MMRLYDDYPDRASDVNCGWNLQVLKHPSVINRSPTDL